MTTFHFSATTEPDSQQAALDAIDHALWLRSAEMLQQEDWALSHCIQAAINEGLTPEQVKRRAESSLGFYESRNLLQTIHNAALHYARILNG